MPNAVFNTLYDLNAQISAGSFTSILQASDVISIAIIHRYDTASYPIIRVRIYADAELIENLAEYPDDINIAVTLYGNIYKTDTSGDTTSIVMPTKAITFSGKGYIENKNIPVSKMDKYKAGIKDTNDLNVDSKVPFELFVYNPEVTHKMRERVQSIYRNSTIETVCRDILRNAGFPENNIKIDPVRNQTRYSQILIPNLTAIESFSFFDKYYGLYQSGGLLYCDITEQSPMIYLCDTTANNSTDTVPIYVRTEKNNASDESGIFVSNGLYRFQTQALNVSVLTESDIERVMNPEDIVTRDMSDPENNQRVRLSELISFNDKLTGIDPKEILHKTKNEYLAQNIASRVNENITQVDLSGVGFDLSLFKPNTRINLVFESPIRGLNMAYCYRIKYACHVLSNISGKLFTPQTAMHLCTNFE